MATKKTTLVLLGIVIGFLAIVFVDEFSVFAHTLIHGLSRIEFEDSPPQLWIEIHDVSPCYGVDKLMEITSIIEEHSNSVDKVVLFVIPNHGGNALLSDYKDFTLTLQELSNKGFIIGAHGYTHKISFANPEFFTSSKSAQLLVERAKKEFNTSGLKEPRYFAPPGWYTSPEVSTLLREEFDFVYYAFFIDLPNGTLPYQTHEYTWYNSNMGGIKKAKIDYQKTRGIFRLSIHINAANSPENLEFLDEFLGWISKQKSIRRNNLLLSR